MSTHDEPGAGGGKFTGYHMLAITVAFFGTIIAVNITLAWFANSSWTGLVVANSYVASQKFDDKTAELQAQAKLGFAARIAFADGAPAVQLTGKSGKPETGATVELAVGRIADARQDVVLALAEGEAGNYRAAARIDPGLWVGELRVKFADGKAWSKPVRLVNGKQ
jgi:nitrogen fixation protein FixH